MLGFVKKRKFFIKLFIFVALMISLFIGISSWSVFIYVEKQTLENEYQYNKKLLGQIKYNIEYIRQVIEDMGMSVFYSYDAGSILYAQHEGEIYELIKKVEKLGSLVQNNSFLHSIYIYNGSMNRFYSSYMSLYFEDATVQELISVNPESKRNRFVARTINDSSEKVFSFMIYDSLNKQGNPDGAVIINVKSQWLLENIKYLNGFNTQSFDHIYLMDEDGNILSTAANQPEGVLDYLRSWYNNREIMNSEFDVFRETFHGKDYGISYFRVVKTGWYIVKIQEYNQFYKFIRNLKVNIVFIAIVFIFLAILVSLAVLGKIYKPIGMLVEEVKNSFLAKQEDIPGNDEISLLQNIYRKSSKELDSYRKKTQSNEQILKNYYLRRMLVDSVGISEEEWKDIEGIHKMFTQFDGKFVICLLRIDNYREFCSKLDSGEQQLFKFTIINVATELIAKYYQNEAVDMGNDQIVILAGVDTDGAEVTGNIQNAINETQKFIKKHFNISFSAAISRFFPNKLEINKNYIETLNLSLNRIILGHASIIPPSMIENIKKEGPVYDSIINEKKIVEYVNSCNIKELEDTIMDTLHHFSEMNYNHIRLYLLRISGIVLDAVEQVNKTKFEPVQLMIDSLVQNILDCETIDEFKDWICELVKNIHDNGENALEEKHTVIVEAMRSIILNNYHNSNLFLQEIASMLKISSTHAGKIFKMVTGTTVTDFIIEVRMEKAVELLIDTSMTVEEIMYRVGIENKSYFFRLFKKKYGDTPRGYALKHVIKEV